MIKIKNPHDDDAIEGGFEDGLYYGFNEGSEMTIEAVIEMLWKYWRGTMDFNLKASLEIIIEKELKEVK